MEKDQTISDLTFAQSGAIKSAEPEPGLIRRIGAYNSKLMLAEHRMKKGWVGGRHSHPQDQLVYVVEGCIRITIGPKTFDAHAGDSFVVNGGTEHQAAALQDSVVIDVFTPSRSEFL